MRAKFVVKLFVQILCRISITRSPDSFDAVEWEHWAWIPGSNPCRGDQRQSSCVALASEGILQMSSTRWIRKKFKASLRKPSLATTRAKKRGCLRPAYGREYAAAWCRSDGQVKRARAAAVLCQLQRASLLQMPYAPEWMFRDESYELITNMLGNEKNPLVLDSAISALGHLRNPNAIPIILRYQDHPDQDVRFAVAFDKAHNGFLF